MNRKVTLGIAAFVATMALGVLSTPREAVAFFGHRGGGCCGCHGGGHRGGLFGHHRRCNGCSGNSCCGQVQTCCGAQNACGNGGGCGDACGSGGCATGGCATGTVDYGGVPAPVPSGDGGAPPAPEGQAPPAPEGNAPSPSDAPAPPQA